MGGENKLFCNFWFVRLLPKKTGQVVRIANHERSEQVVLVLVLAISLSVIYLFGIFSFALIIVF